MHVVGALAALTGLTAMDYGFVWPGLALSASGIAMVFAWNWGAR